MTSVVTLDVFSGRPNPTFELTRDHIDALRTELARERDATMLKPLTASTGRLGYRGFIIDSVREDLPERLNVGGGVFEELRDSPSLLDPERRVELLLLEIMAPSLDPDIIAEVGRGLRAAMVAPEMRAITSSRQASSANRC